MEKKIDATRHLLVKELTITEESGSGALCAHLASEHTLLPFILQHVVTEHTCEALEQWFAQHFRPFIQYLGEKQHLKELNIILTHIRKFIEESCSDLAVQTSSITACNYR